MSELTADREAVTPAARAFVGLSEGDDLAERSVSRARKAVVLTMALGAVVAPTFWAANAAASDGDQPLATLNKSQGSGDEGDDDNSGEGGGDDDNSGNDDTGNGGATDRGGDTSANGEDTAGTTAGTGASLTNDDNDDTGNGGATDRGGDTSANGEDTAGTTAGTGASLTNQD